MRWLGHPHPLADKNSGCKDAEQKFKEVSIHGNLTDERFSAGVAHFRRAYNQKMAHQTTSKGGVTAMAWFVP